MIQPDEKTLHHIAMLQSDPHFAPLRELLRTSLADAQARMVTAQGIPQIRLLQGRARQLGEILNYCDNAHDHIKAIDTAKRISSQHLT